MYGPLLPSGAPSDPRLVANLINGEISKLVNDAAIQWWQVPFTGESLGHVVKLLLLQTISLKGAKDIFEHFWRPRIAENRHVQADDVDAIIESKGLKQMNDSGELEKIIDEVLAANADNIAQYRAGKDKAFNALVGQAMKASKGKANPAQVNALLKTKLG